MTDTPETHYARSADGTNLAYQVSGDGPLDLVFIHGVAVPIDLLSEDPGFARLRSRLSAFGRTLWSDPRGRGASEGSVDDSLPGQIFDADLLALLDAAGFERPALVGESVFGARAIHFCAFHPDRVSALILVNSFAHYVRGAGSPSALP
jgi:pimeloyl-ACP methyl ester carboxylesterase